MCLAIPGKVVKIIDSTSILRYALIDFGGVKKEICIAWIDAKEGDYILAHAGMALAIIDENEAKLTENLLNATEHK